MSSTTASVVDVDASEDDSDSDDDNYRREWGLDDSPSEFDGFTDGEPDDEGELDDDDDLDDSSDLDDEDAAALAEVSPRDKDLDTSYL